MSHGPGPPHTPAEHGAAHRADGGPTWVAYAITLGATAATFLACWALGAVAGDPLLALFLLPILLGAYLGGTGPGLAATAATAALASAFLLGPPIAAHPAEVAVLALAGSLASWLAGARRGAAANRRLLETALGSVDDAVITADRRGRVTFLNAQAERLTGWSAATAAGMPLGEVFRAIDEETRAPIADPAGGQATGPPAGVLLRARDGREIPIGDSGAPIRAASGQAGRLVIVFRDISARRQAEEELRSSKQTFRIFVEHTPAAIAMFDRSMRYLAVSRRFLSDYHLGEQEIVGRSHYDIFPELPERWRVIHRRCLEDATGCCEMDPFPRADGSVDWVRWELRPWYERPGVVGGLVLFSEVVTEQVRAEEELRASEARYHQALDSMLEGCQIIGFDWCFRYVNESAARHGRVDRSMILGRGMLEVFPDIEATPLFAALRRCMEQRRAERLEHQFIYADGSSAWFDLSVQPSPEGLFVLSIEISERKEAEAALVAERARLAEHVAEATAGLRQANTELAAAARLKDEFLAIMSHELRTPLNAILGYTELLRDEVYGPVSPRQAGVLQSLGASGHHLHELISDILDLSKLAAGRLTLDPVPVDVSALCQRGMRVVSEEALRRHIKLSASLDPRVGTLVADERRLLQILINLLANAIKFTPEGGRVGLELRGDDRTATFTVWDTGIGIAEADLGQLFQPFSQLDSGLNRQYEGTGLGLALAQRLAMAHGGAITVTSAPGQGSRFSVALPWAGLPAHASPASPAPD